MLWIVLAALTLVTVWWLLRPLLRGSRAAPTRAAYDVAVYRDQLAEVRREASSGIISANEAEAAEREIARRLLDAAAEEESEARARSAALEKGRTARRWGALGIAALVPLAAFAFYLVIGAPGVPDFPLAERGAAMQAMGMPDLATAISRLEARLKANPNDLEGWLLMARTTAALGRYDAAAEAYRKAVDLSQRRADIVASYAEALVMQDSGLVTEQARNLFEEAHAKQPSDPRPRFYIGLAKAQSGDGAGAIRDWLALEAQAPTDAPWLPALRQQIQQTATEFKLDPATLAPRQAPQPPGSAPAPKP